MAHPGGDYTGFSGLDLTMDGGIGEYHIDPEQTPFRVWMSTERSLTDGSSATTDGGFDTDSCYSSMNFRTSSIQNQTFNLDGTDDLIWAANGQDYYMMYHGANRGRFSIDWTTGELTLLSTPPFSDDGHDGSPTAAPGGESSWASPRLLSSSWLAVVLIGVIAGQLS